MCGLRARPNWDGHFGDDDSGRMPGGARANLRRQSRGLELRGFCVFPIGTARNVDDGDFDSLEDTDFADFVSLQLGQRCMWTIGTSAISKTRISRVLGPSCWDGVGGRNPRLSFHLDDKSGR